MRKAKTDVYGVLGPMMGGIRHPLKTTICRLFAPACCRYRCRCFDITKWTTNKLYTAHIPLPCYANFTSGMLAFSHSPMLSPAHFGQPAATMFNCIVFDVCTILFQLLFARSMRIKENGRLFSLHCLMLLLLLSSSSLLLLWCLTWTDNSNGNSNNKIWYWQWFNTIMRTITVVWMLI